MKEGKYEKRVQMKYQDQNKIEIDVIFTLANLFTNELLRKDLEIHLDTLANPGWFFTINLNSIVSCNSNDYIVLKSIKKSDSDWIELFTQNKELRFAASTFNLIKSFRLLFEYIEKYIGSDFIIYGENEILNKVGLENRKDNFPSQLSGGEQQRVAIARAIAKNPKLLLCDEPTGALDYKTGKSILKLLQNMARKENMTVIIITHNGAISPMADKVIHFKNGTAEKIIINENPESIDNIEW